MHTGSMAVKLIMVRTAKRFAGPMCSPTGADIAFLENIPRSAKERFEPIAKGRGERGRGGEMGRAFVTTVIALFDWSF